MNPNHTATILQFDADGDNSHVRQFRKLGRTGIPMRVTLALHKRTPTRRLIREVARNPSADTAGPVAMGWDDALKVWREYARGNINSTLRAMHTPWMELQRLAGEHDIHAPGGVTPDLMRKFVEQMVNRGLAVSTVKMRLSKIRSVFRVLVGRGMLKSNPASDTLTPRENFTGSASRHRRLKPVDLTAFFSLDLFNARQLRPGGQIGEASYWIPILMFYTGARVEELANLALPDVVHNPNGGSCIKFFERSADEKRALNGQPELWSTTEFWNQTIDDEHGIYGLNLPYRTRSVPLAAQLVELGLLRYLGWRHQQGHQWLFPELVEDCNGRRGGAVLKVLRRCKGESLGIESCGGLQRSLRLSFVNALSQARVPVHLQKLLMGYDNGLNQGAAIFGNQSIPLHDLMCDFEKIEFLSNPAQPWRPGQGIFKYPKPPQARD